MEREAKPGYHRCRSQDQHQEAYIWNAQDGSPGIMGLAPVNCKQIQRICQKTGYIESHKTKNNIIRIRRKLFKPEAPNRLWEIDITYIGAE